MLSRVLRCRLPRLEYGSTEVWVRLRNVMESSKVAATMSTECVRGGPVTGGGVPRLPITEGGGEDDSSKTTSPTPKPPPPPPPPQKPPPSTSNKNQKLPRIFYIPNPIIWLTNKIDFSLLRYEWDPKFSEAEFRRGATQAVCTITQLVADKHISELSGLLTRRAQEQLELEVESQWGNLQRRFIGIEPSNVQIALPRRVHFRTAANKDSSVSAERKMCDVDMVFIALKWIEAGAARAIVFVEIMARFHREYTQGVIPEWTVSAFKVSRYNIMPR